MEEKVVCPNCNLNDKIEKVSAIIASQTHHSSSYPYQPGVSTYQVSTLAQLLIAPQKTELKVRPTGGIIGPSRKTFFGELGFYGNILLFGIIGICLIQIALSGNQTGSLLLLGLGALGFAVYYYRSSQEKLKKGEAEYNKAISKWNEAITKWEHLYYCYRDDIVFNPVDKKTASPKDIAQLYD